MNTYYKFAPNVFLAKCDEKHEKGETIEVTTKYGKENECIVFNLIYERDGFYYYSIVRADGFNVKSGLNKGLNVVMNGLHLLYRKAVNTTTSPIKIRIFFL
jgi:hypothetical protein